MLPRPLSRSRPAATETETATIPRTAIARARDTARDSTARSRHRDRAVAYRTHHGTRLQQHHCPDRHRSRGVPLQDRHHPRMPDLLRRDQRPRRVRPHDLAIRRGIAHDVSPPLRPHPRLRRTPGRHRGRTPLQRTTMRARRCGPRHLLHPISQPRLRRRVRTRHRTAPRPRRRTHPRRTLPRRP